MIRWLVSIVVVVAVLVLWACPLPETVTVTQSLTVDVPDALCAPGAVCLLCDGLSVENVDHVELAPAFTYSGPGNAFRIEAVPVLANGLPVRGTGITVTWPPLPFLQVAAPDAKFDLPANATAQEVTGLAPKVGNRTTLVPGAVRIGSPPSLPVGDVLATAHVPGSTPEGVLVHWPPLPDAAPGGDCDKGTSTAFAMAGEAHLERSLTTTCTPDVALFTAGRGAMLLSSGGRPPSAAQATSNALPPVPPAQRSVVVYLRTDQAAPPDPTAFPGAVASAQAIADRLYSMDRTGIAFDWITTATAPSDFTWPLATPTSAYSPYPLDCQDGILASQLGVPMSADSAPPGERWSEQEIYVVFVPSIKYQHPAFTCDRSPLRGPVIIMSSAHFNPTTLSHELAHVFGMYDELPSYGHVETEADFTPANLLWGAPDVCTGRSRERFSLGQLYRMNLDTGSWLRHQGPVDTTVACQKDFKEGACPAVALDFPRGTN